MKFIYKQLNYWKSSSFRKELELYKTLIKELNEFNHSYFTRANARKELKRILKIFYPEYYKSGTQDDWNDLFYELTPEGHKESIEQAYEEMMDQIKECNEDIEFLNDSGRVSEINEVKEQIKFIKLKYKFAKRDASEDFANILVGEFAKHQSNPTYQKKFINKYYKNEIGMRFDLDSKIKLFIEKGYLK